MSAGRLVNILIHVLFTVLIITVPVFLKPMSHSNTPEFWNIPLILFTLIQVGAFYLNAYYLYPQLLLKKQVMWYILVVVIICIITSLIPLGITYSKPSWAYRNVYAQMGVHFFIGLFVMGTATSYRFILDVIKGQRLEKEHLSIELAFLRSQVSPHFMFNTLNSMVALARKKSDKLEPALLKMSELMSYMLYDSDEEKVSLQKEIDYIQSYIDLQTMRFGNSVKILFMVNHTSDNISIEPMLLIPLIENAFKHGVNVVTAPEINISLNSTQSEINLSVSNKANLYHTNSGERRGIGLTNLQKRLTLLYPDCHQLNIRKEGSWHHADLKISLQK